MALAVKARVDDLEHGLVVQGSGQELENRGEMLFRFGDEVVIAGVMDVDVGLVRKPIGHVGEMFLVNAGEFFVTDVVGRFALADEHFLLGGEDFIQVAAHKDDFVGVGGRKVFEQDGDDLDSFPAGIVQPLVVFFFEFLNAFEFVIALGVALVSLAQVVSDDG